MLAVQRFGVLCLLALPLLGFLSRGGEFRAGLRAFAEGRYPEALEAFRAEEEGLGQGASAELLYNRALAALMTRSLTEAEAAAERMAARGGERFVALRDFLLGNTAFARAEIIELQAETPGAPPFAFDEAIAMAQSARRAWQRAALGRTDWPQARRNVERALVKIEELKEKKERLIQEQAERLAAGERPALVIADELEGESEGTGEEAEQVPSAQAESAALTPGELQRFFEVLEAREREKLELRRARRIEPGRVGERDW